MNYRNDKIDAYFKYSTSSEIKYSQVLNQKIEKDLNLEEVIHRIDSCLTPIGSQLLYFRIKCLRNRTILEIEEDREFRNYLKDIEIQKNLYSLLNRLRDSAGWLIVGFFTIKAPTHKSIYILSRCLQFFNLFFLALIILQFNFIVPFIISLVISAILHYQNKFRLGQFITGFPYILEMIECANIIQRDKSMLPKFPSFDFTSEIQSLNKIKSKLRFFKTEISLQKDPTAITWYFSELLKIFFVIEPILLHLLLKELPDKSKELESVFRKIGSIDTELNLIELSNKYTTCTPDFVNLGNISFLNVYHPLVNSPVSNNYDFSGNGVITGSNMSGKSTFIKTIGVNLILGLAFDLCFAQKVSLHYCEIYSIMNQNDDIINGKSLFENEVIDLGQIIQAPANNSLYKVYLIDELFKGTNAVERISITTSVLNFLALSNNAILCSTHDLEITNYLHKSFKAYYFSEKVKNNSLIFDYKIKTGKLKNTNAIEVLKLYNYPNEVIEQALFIKKKLSD